MTRLRAMENTSDGFKLAEIDLETRGPGAIFGLEQSGSWDLKMASLSDLPLIEAAAKAGKEIAPELNKYPLLKEKLNQFVTSKHME